MVGMLGLIGMIMLLVGLGDKFMRPSEQHLYDEKIARNYVSDVLSDKNKKLNELKARES